MADDKILPDTVIRADNYIDEADQDVDPTEDEGRVPKIEEDGKVSEVFLRYVGKLVADEDLAAGVPVGIGIGGKVSRAVRAAATGATNIPSDLDGAFIHKVRRVAASKYVCLYGNSSTALRAVAFSISADTLGITFGSPTTVSASVGNNHAGLAPLNTDKFVVVFADTNNDPNYAVFTISTLTISSAGSGNFGSMSITQGTCCEVDTDRFAFWFYAQDASDCYRGHASVSGGTATVLDSETGSVSNMTNTDYVTMAKLGTDKFVVLQGQSGYALVGTTVGSTYAIGTAVQVCTTGGGANKPAAVLSIAADTFWARLNGDIGYATVSSLVVTKVDEEAVADENDGYELTTDGTDIIEIVRSTVAAKCGIHKLTVSGGTTIVRTPIYGFSLGETLLPFRGDYDPTSGRYALVAGVSTSAPVQFHVKGMAAGYAGFTEAAVERDASVKVIFGGIVPNQTSLLPGARYKINQGGLELTMNPTEQYAVSAKSATEVML